jgi:hypothetical protein
MVRNWENWENWEFGVWNFAWLKVRKGLSFNINFTEQ